MGSIISRGTSGTVCLFRDSESGKLCVHKTANSVKKNRYLENEDDFLRILGGRHVVERYGSFVDKNGRVTIVLEYFPLDLRRMMAREEVCCFSTKRRMIFEILRGIEYIHSRGVAHNDLKPENILVNGDYSSVKICDFGMATGISSKAIKYDEVSGWQVWWVVVQCSGMNLRRRTSLLGQ